MKRLQCFDYRGVLFCNIGVQKVTLVDHWNLVDNANHVVAIWMVLSAVIVVL